MNQIVKSTGIKYGLISASIGVLYTVIGYAIFFDLLANFWLGMALYGVAIVLFILGVVSSKKQMGGFISFRDAFSTYILSYLVSGFISVTVSYLLFTVIDPDAADRIKEITIEKSVAFMESIGSSEEQIETSIERTEQMDMFALGTQLKGFLFNGLIFHAVIGLITALVIRKSKPAHLEGLEAEDFGKND